MFGFRYAGEIAGHGSFSTGNAKQCFFGPTLIAGMQHDLVAVCNQ